MNKSLDMIIDSLDKANEIYAELLGLSEKKRALIYEENIEELEKIVTYEMGLVGSLYKIEDIRGKAVDNLVSQQGFQPFSTLTELANQLPEQERRILLDKKNKLLVGIKTLSEETKFNSKIIEDKIALIDLSVQMLTASDEGVGYGDNTNKKSMLDVRI